MSTEPRFARAAAGWENTCTSLYAFIALSSSFPFTDSTLSPLSDVDVGNLLSRKRRKRAARERQAAEEKSETQGSASEAKEGTVGSNSGLASESGDKVESVKGNDEESAMNA
jgi:hypothetical protein